MSGGGGGGGRHVSLTLTSGHSHSTFSPRPQHDWRLAAYCSHVHLRNPSSASRRRRRSSGSRRETGEDSKLAAASPGGERRLAAVYLTSAGLSVDPAQTVQFSSERRWEADGEGERGGQRKRRRRAEL